MNEQQIRAMLKWLELDSVSQALRKNAFDFEQDDPQRQDHLRSAENAEQAMRQLRADHGFTPAEAKKALQNGLLIIDEQPVSQIQDFRTPQRDPDPEDLSDWARGSPQPQSRKGRQQDRELYNLNPLEQWDANLPKYQDIKPSKQVRFKNQAPGFLSNAGSAIGSTLSRIADVGSRGANAVFSSLGDVSQRAGELGVEKAGAAVVGKLGGRYPWLKELLGEGSNKSQKALGMAFANALSKRKGFIPTNLKRGQGDLRDLDERIGALLEPENPEEEDKTALPNLALKQYLRDRFTIDPEGNMVYLPPESFANFIGRNKEENKQQYLPEGEFTEEEINTRHANNPMEARYMAQLSPDAIKYKEDYRNKIIKELDNKHWADNRFTGVSKEYNDLFEGGVINPLIGQMREEFLDPHKGVLNEVANKMIKTGNYGSSVHGRLAQDAARNFQKDMMQKIGALRGQAYQQSAQLHASDRDAAFRQTVARQNLLDQELNQDQRQEMIYEGIANKLQHERQQQLGHAWARKREAEERPMQELAQMQRIREGQPYQPIPDAQAVLPEQHVGFHGGFRRGGRVMSPKVLARQLMAKGRHGDTMLAHINPVEAAFLKAMGGSGSINPNTGIPEYFNFNDLIDMGKKGLSISSMLGGGGGNITEKLNALPFNLGNVGLGSGLDGLPTLQSTPDSEVGAVNIAAPRGGGFWEGVGGFLKDNAVPMIGLGASIYDANERRKQERAIQRQENDRFEYEKRVAELIRAGIEKSKAQKIAKEQMLKAKRQAHRAKILGGEYDAAPQLSEDGTKYLGGEKAHSQGVRMSFGPSHRGLSRGGPVHRFANGGYVKGSDSGVKDNIPVQIPEGSYVLDALTVSLLGDGNSSAGVKEFDRLKQHLRTKENSYYDGGMYNKSALDRHMVKHAKAGGEISRVRGKGDVHAVVSGGEIIIPPEEVVLFSHDGSLNDGARRLDKFRSKIRKQKGVPSKQTLLPKTKALKSYL